MKKEQAASQKTLLSLLNSNNYGTYHKPLAKKLGPLEAILIGHLIYRYQFYEAQGSLTEGEWFYCTNEEFYEEIGLTRKPLDRILASLKELKIIETKLMGVPAKRFIKINVERLFEVINDTPPPIEGQSSLSKMDKLECPKGANSSDIYINKEKKKDKTPRAPKGGDPPPSASKRRLVREELIQRCERVFTTESQHASLLKKAKGDEKLVEQWYWKLSEWKIGKGIHGGNDYLSILRWVIGSTIGDQTSIHTNVGNKEKNTTKGKSPREIANSIEKIYQSNSYSSVNAGTNALSFSSSNRSFYKDVSLDIPINIFIEECNRCLKGIGAPFKIDIDGNTERIT